MAYARNRTTSNYDDLMEYEGLRINYRTGRTRRDRKKGNKGNGKTSTFPKEWLE